MAFLEAGYLIVVLDNLSNASSPSLERVAQITGWSIAFEIADIRDQARLETILKQHGCTAVVHLAGLKVVGESTQFPLAYYDNNVVGTHRLLSAMANCSIRQMIFSSSAAVYGEPKYLP